MRRLSIAVADPKRAFNSAIRRFKEKFLWESYYRALPRHKTRGWIPHKPEIHDAVLQELRAEGYDTQDYIIDPADYRRYLEMANYERFPNYYHGGTSANFTEKSLEHYLAARFLDLSRDDLYIDIANDGAPVPEIYHGLFGCEAYRQDIKFKPGVNGRTIGGDAARLPVPSNFATKMALHCSFEHFELDSDVGFIREAGRVLRDGGRLVVVPLYLFEEYAIQVDPVTLPKGAHIFDAAARIYGARGYGNRHGRFYNVRQFTSRIRNNLGPLHLTVYVVRNEREIDPSCYAKFIAVCQKNASLLLGCSPKTS